MEIAGAKVNNLLCLPWSVILLYYFTFHLLKKLHINCSKLYSGLLFSRSILKDSGIIFWYLCVCTHRHADTHIHISS